MPELQQDPISVLKASTLNIERSPCHLLINSHNIIRNPIYREPTFNNKHPCIKSPISIHQITNINQVCNIGNLCICISETPIILVRNVYLQSKVQLCYTIIYLFWRTKIVFFKQSNEELLEMVNQRPILTGHKMPDFGLIIASIIISIFFYG